MYRADTKCYIGETGRRLWDGFQEHLRSTSTNNDPPVFGRLFSSAGHSPDKMRGSFFRTVLFSASAQTEIVHANVPSTSTDEEAEVSTFQKSASLCFQHEISNTDEVKYNLLR